MLHKIFNKKSGSSAGVVKYVLGMTKHDHALQQMTFLGGTVLSDDPLVRVPGGGIVDTEPAELIAEIDENNALHSSKNVKGVWHGMLSLPAGERLTDAQWKEVTTNYMSKMGFAGSPWFAVKHADTDNEHVHIVASRVYYDGSMRRGRNGPAVGGYAVVKDSNDHEAGMSICRQIEQHFNLSSPPSPEATNGRDISLAEAGTSASAGRLHPKKVAAEIVCCALTVCKEFSGGLKMLLEVCSEMGVGVAVRFGDKREPVGISYSYVDDSGVQQVWTGKQLKKARLTMPKLIKQEGLEYDKDRDFQAIERYSQIEARRRAGSGAVVAVAESIAQVREQEGVAQELTAKRQKIEKISDQGLSIIAEPTAHADSEPPYNACETVAERPPEIAPLYSTDCTPDASG